MKKKGCKVSLLILSACLSLASCSSTRVTSSAADSPRRYDSMRGLVMAGYQGWFNAEGDGSGRGFYHYSGLDGFRPGSASVDMWPETSEYEHTYPTPFTMPDGSVARVFSSEDSTTVATHFRWMREYGLDGVYMQRFVAEIKNPSGKRHFDRVLDLAMASARNEGRAIAVMYDLSGIAANDCDLVLSDIDTLAIRHSLFDRNQNPSYLYHNGKPMVAVWGIGFNDGRAYGLADCRRIVDGLRSRGYSILLGVPTNWRTLNGDTEANPELHAMIKDCDVVMPWFVGRYDEVGYERFVPLIGEDIRWCAEAGVDYAPLVYPGFSWKNMCGEDSFNVPRNGGKFFTRQLDGAIGAGAKMIYVAMFDEIDEGTAIFKCAHEVPIAETGSEFVPLDATTPSDFYLRAAGAAARRLKEERPADEIASK